MKTPKYFLLLMLLTIVSNISAQPQNSKTKKEIIKIEVEGLTCPFCAYGLEKKLNKINGIENLKIDFGKATVLLTSTNIHNISDSTLKKVIEDSGFTPQKITRKSFTAKTKIK